MDTERCEPTLEEELMGQYGWLWNTPPEYPSLIELHDSAGAMLGWISARPPYCDRGHYQVNVEIGGIDDADRFPRYYMRLSTAKQELLEFLAWRIYKRRAS